MTERAPAPAEPVPNEPGASPRGGWRRSAIVLGVLVAVLVPIAARVAIEGQAELAAADVARARDDVDGEIEHLGRALRWRMPGRDHDDVARERLWAIGQAQEARGADGRDAALAAYGELREGLLGTRVWGIPHREDWEAANLRIAVLMAAVERDYGEGRELEEREAFHRVLLGEEPGPDPVRANLAALAFAGWVVCTAGLLVRGLGPRGRLRPRAALRWGLGAVLSFVAWAVLLATAHG